MLQALVHILFDAAIMLAASRYMKTIFVKDYKTSLMVAVAVGIMSFFISWILIFVLNVVTLGIPALLGLGFLIRIIANGILIEIADRFFNDFETKGIVSSLVLAGIVALAGAIFDAVLF